MIAPDRPPIRLRGGDEHWPRKVASLALGLAAAAVALLPAFAFAQSSAGASAPSTASTSRAANAGAAAGAAGVAASSGAVTFPVAEPWPIRATADAAPGPSPALRAGVAPAARGSETETEGLFARLTRQPLRLVSAGRTLGDLQAQMETALGVRLILSSGAATIPVSGEIAGENGLAFIRELAARLRLEWAFGRDGIFLAPDGSSRAVSFTAPSAVIASRTATLANREFEEMGSGIRVAARKEDVVVTGIPGWINQVAALRVPALIDFVQRTMAQQAARKAAAEAAEEAARRAAEEAAQAEEAARKAAVEAAEAARKAAAEAEEASRRSAEDAALAARNRAAAGPAPVGPLSPPPPSPAPSPRGEPLSLMVFRLNNAYVDDKKISVGSSSVTIQGVASLFRQFTGLAGGDMGPSGFAQDNSAVRLQRLDPLAGGRGDARIERDDGVLRMPQRSALSNFNEPVVVADSRMNTLMVRDRASMLEPYKALINVLDQPTDMVQLDAFVIDIKASRLDEFGLGLSWGGSSRVNSPGISPGGALPAGANLILQAARGAQLLAQIRALETRGDSEILTVPSVVTLNNLEATFSARQSFFVKVSGNQDASLTKVTAETLLKVTPLVAQAEANPGHGNDRRIRLLISVQDGTVDASSSAVVDNLPRTLENQISTQAVVRGGDTLVIGGQVVRKRVNRVSGLPILKDIPLIGALTNSRSDDYEQYVRVYVVRPRILGDGSMSLTEPVAAERSDPLVHGVVGRVPELIKGSGLSPQGQDATRPARSREAVESLVVVPVPKPEPILPPAPLLQRSGPAISPAAAAIPSPAPAAPPAPSPSPSPSPGAGAATGPAASTGTGTGAAAGAASDAGTVSGPRPAAAAAAAGTAPVAAPRDRRDGSAEDSARKESADKAVSGDKDKATKDVKPPAEAPALDDWNPDDPIWRPPGSPLGRRLPQAPAVSAPPSSSAPSTAPASAAASRPATAGPAGTRVDSATQASRDRQALQILESEFRRAEQQVQRLQGEPVQDSPAVREALGRARADVQALRNEINRLGAPAAARTAPASSPPAAASTAPGAAGARPTAPSSTPAPSPAIR